jgi:hypothetical protein
MRATQKKLFEKKKQFRDMIVSLSCTVFTRKEHRKIAKDVPTNTILDEEERRVLRVWVKKVWKLDDIIVFKKSKTGRKESKRQEEEALKTSI